MARGYPKLDRAQFASLRQKIDPHFIDLKRELDDCLRGTLPDGWWDAEGIPRRGARAARVEDGWAHGVSHAFDAGGGVVYDFVAGEAIKDGVPLVPTITEAIELHASLQAHIDAMRVKALALQNEADGTPHPEASVKSRLVDIGPDPVDPTIEERYRRETVDVKAEAEAKLSTDKGKGIEVTRDVTIALGP